MSACAESPDGLAASARPAWCAAHIGSSFRRCGPLSPRLDAPEDPAHHREIPELQQEQCEERDRRRLPLVPLLQTGDQARAAAPHRPARARPTSATPGCQNEATSSGTPIRESAPARTDTIHAHAVEGFLATGAGVQPPGSSRAKTDFVSIAATRPGARGVRPRQPCPPRYCRCTDRRSDARDECGRCTRTSRRSVRCRGSTRNSSRVAMVGSLRLHS